MMKRNNSIVLKGIDKASDHFDVQATRFNTETEEATKEAEDIAAGRIETKSYRSVEELFADIDAE